MEREAKLFKYQLEILRVAARDPNTENKRVNQSPLKSWQLDSSRFQS